MPTKRTIDELYALFAPGQPAASITPDRVQDLVLTLQGGWGRMSLVESAQTVIVQSGSWVKAAGVTALAEHSQQFVMPENNRLQCVCPIPSIMEVAAVISIVNGNNKTFEAAIAVNGEVRPESVRTFRIGSGGDVVEAVILDDFLQAEGDYVEVWIRNLTDAADATITRLYLRARTYVA